MQIAATTKTLPIAPGGCLEPPPAAGPMPPHGPIGVSTYGKMEIRYGKDSKKIFDVLGPLVAPKTLTATSLEDAIKATRELVASNPKNAALGFIVHGSANTWIASPVAFDDAMLEAYNAQSGSEISFRLFDAQAGTRALVGPSGRVGYFAQTKN